MAEGIAEIAMRLGEGRNKRERCQENVKGGVHAMQKILIPESVNVFDLVGKGRDADKVTKAVNTVLEAIKDLDLTVGECYTFIDLIVAALHEKKMKF